jgi:NitT/TauT family transport system ATP-binding protein
MDNGANEKGTGTVTMGEDVSKKAPVVQLSNVGKWFPALRHGKPVIAVKGVDLEIPAQERGQFVVFLGPSGCGKSTVLSMISGLQMPDEGEVRIFGEPVTGPDKHTVTVQQAYTCFPWLTVLGNVQFGLAVEGKSRQDQQRIATEYLKRVGLGNRLDATPRQLSGGMQQRVAIARTLALKPPIVLMDEPFGALDAQTRGDMQQMLLSLWAEEKNTIIFVTHDITEAVLLADRIIVFSPSPARIVLDKLVPFARPRLPSLVVESDFIRWSQFLLQTLKGAEADGGTAPGTPVDKESQPTAKTF